jgi:hypothetical protein
VHPGAEAEVPVGISADIKARWLGEHVTIPIRRRITQTDGFACADGNTTDHRVADLLPSGAPTAWGAPAIVAAIAFTSNALGMRAVLVGHSASRAAATPALRSALCRGTGAAQTMRAAEAAAG